MSIDKRIHKRIHLPATVKLMHPDIGEVRLKARDVSDGGVYLYCDDPELLPIGSEAMMQAINEDMEMPIIDVKIVRKDSEGMGLEFINQ